MSYHIREAQATDAPALADVVLIPTITTFQGLVPDQCLAWLTPAESCANWERWFQRSEDDGKFLLVAEGASGLVVGCALAGPQPNEPEFHSELYLLNILPDHQGQGIGQQLIQSAAHRLLHMGLTTMGVRVVSVNPNRRFYERRGALFVREQPYEWNGVPLYEAIYVWPDLRLLGGTEGNLTQADPDV